jgi:cytochrome P450
VAVAIPDEAGVRASFDAPAEPAPVPADDPEALVARIFDGRRRGELYPLYHALRSRAPVHRTDDPHMRGVWLVTRFADAMAIYRDPRAVSDPATAEHFNHGGAGGPFSQLLKQAMLFLESEDHARVRRIVAHAFTPRAIARVRPITERISGELLDRVAALGEMDVVAGFAYPLPVKVIARLLGVPESDLPEIERYAWDFARGSELSAVEDDRTRRADAAALGFRGYFEHLIAERRRDLGDDVLSALIAAEDDGARLSHDEVIATSVLLLQAGHETTTDALGNALVALFRHPDQLTALRRDPALTRNAVEELLRYDSTNQLNNRLLLDDASLGGLRVAAGDHVAVLIGAANRDPAQVPEPDRLQLERPTPQHVAFAFGAYHCVGSALARTELDVALRALLERLPGLRPATDTFTWRDTLRNRGPQELRIAWTPAPPAP